VTKVLQTPKSKIYDKRETLNAKIFRREGNSPEYQIRSLNVI